MSTKELFSVDNTFDLRYQYGNANRNILNTLTVQVMNMQICN